ncbi:hypothetical protein P4O32_005733, partial [Klebsiella oxytoca]
LRSKHMKGNKYIKRVRVDSRQLDSGMFGTKVYITEGEVVDGIMPVERLVRDTKFSEANSEAMDSAVERLVNKYRSNGFEVL